jgi:hypothetical protein
MEEFNRYNPFVSAFTSMKLRYADYDESLGSKNFLVPTDKVNVFISMESVLKKISMIQDLDKIILLDKDYPITIISEILNLIAHYKRFFESNGLDTRVYVYQTDLKSSTFPESIYNEDFRCYYLVKYNDNPKYVSFTETFLDVIMPEVKTYCDFIPNVYYITATNIEGSLIPLVISKKDDWERTRMISFWAARPHYKRLKMKDVMTFSWETEQNTIKTEIHTTEDDINQLRQLFMNQKQSQ